MNIARKELNTATQGYIPTPIEHKFYGSGFPSPDVDKTIASIRQSQNPQARRELRQVLLTPVGINLAVLSGQVNYSGSIPQLNSEREKLHLVGNLTIFTEFVRRARGKIVIDIELAGVADALTGETIPEWNVTAGTKDATGNLQIDDNELQTLDLTPNNKGWLVLELAHPGAHTRRLKLADDILSP